MFPKHMPDEVKKLRPKPVGCRVSSSIGYNANTSFDYILSKTDFNERVIKQNGFVLNDLLSNGVRKEYSLTTPGKQEINIILIEDIHITTGVLNAPIKRFVQWDN